MNLTKSYLILITMLSATAVSRAEAKFVDITSRYIANADFNNGNSDGWTIESNAGQRAVSANTMRFYDGTFHFYQQLSGLPKGTYRLSVQGFYRQRTDSYADYKNGTERLTAYLYAGDVSTPLVSVYSQPMTSNTGSRQQHDGLFYPDNSTSAAAAFAEGNYKGNNVEFQAEGSVTIGVRCNENESGNYCVFDNFRLEYATSVDGKAWVDVTQYYLKNSGFDSGKGGWNVSSNAMSQNVGYGSMEFWNGYFDIWQDVSDAPAGQYRLSVQAFYRCKDNKIDWLPDGGDYYDFLNGRQNITAYVYAGEALQPLASVYSEASADYVNEAWRVDGKYYPNSMSSAREFFDRGLYWNVMEFDGGGDFSIGLRCQEYESSNWCIFDNFRLEYYTDVVMVQGITVSIDHTELVTGETVEATITLQPVIATLPFTDWTSSNEHVATVDRNGIITAVGEGTAVITATAVDGSGVSGSVTVTVAHNAATAGSLVINEIMASNVDEYISPAFNFDGWVELYNPGNRAVELGGVVVSDPADPGNTWAMPQTAGVVPAKGFKVVWYDSNIGNPNNAPFKLDTDGGTVIFSTPGGQEIARQTYPASLERISYGRQGDGSGDWGLCAEATPGSSNSTVTQATQIEPPVVDTDSRLFTSPLNVHVDIPEGCTLHYTTDGRLPSPGVGEVSTTGDFTVGDTRCYRFRLFSNDNSRLPSRVITRSYIYKDRDYYLPVISVVSDPRFLYDPEIGVMTTGPNGRPGNGRDDLCNWNMDWERPVNFSFLDAEGRMVLNQDVNLEMCGGWSRGFTPHSFKLKGNKELGGDKNLQYPFFEQKPFIRNRTLQIRNGGNDNSCRFKDPALQYIVETSGVGLDCQSYQPVHEFINGEYIGVLNMREPNNKHYVYANYGWDDDQIDQFEMSPDSGYVQKCGTPEVFNELVDVLSPDAANAQTYAEICRILDIDDYINYMAAELYLGGTDFPQNNIKAFRHRDNGRFRFVLFDLDFAFNSGNPFGDFFGKEYYWFDQLRPASLGRIHDQIRLVTLFKNMLQNADFRRRFIDAYCIMGGSVFEKSRATAIVDELFNRVEPAMNLMVSGWWKESANPTAENLKSGLSNRLGTAISAIRNYSTFQLSGTTPQRVSMTSDTKGARLFINNEAVPTGNFDGQLFAPVTVRAEAPAGYVFSGWYESSGRAVSSRNSMSLPTGDMELIAKFRKMTAAEKQKAGCTPVCINEVSGANDSYISEYGKKDDWVELYNTTDEPVDVEGMYLSDNASKPTKFLITKGTTQAQTVIPPHGYLIIWCSKRETTDQGLHASFKISDDGGVITLTAADQSWTDRVRYDAHDARTTIGRYPDGGQTVYTMNVATIGKSNIFSSYVTEVDQADEAVAVSQLEAPGSLRALYASGSLLVKSGQDGEVSIELFRADGMLVQQTTARVDGGSASMSLDNLPQGFYVARVTDGKGGKASCRFVK